MIDKAYATNCNRSEESSASPIAARRSIPSANLVVIPSCSFPDFEGFGDVGFVQHYSSHGLCRFSLDEHPKQER